MHKKNLLLLALFLWVICITTLSLTSFNSFPKIAPVNSDKYVHFVFYFILTLLLVLNALNKTTLRKVVVFSFLATVFYGIIIEILQGVLTEDRKPELADVLSNTVGSFLASIFILLNRKRLNFIK